VPFKTARSFLSRRTLAIALVLSLCAKAQDGGVVLDAPLILQLPNGHFDFNPPAVKAVDEELKRLQQLEREHNQEPSWATPVLVGLIIGVTAGLAAGVAGTLVVKSALDAKP
jgi:hypothetical protein